MARRGAVARAERSATSLVITRMRHACTRQERFTYDALGLKTITFGYDVFLHLLCLTAPASGAPHPSFLILHLSSASPKPPLAPYLLQPLPWCLPSAPLGSAPGRRSPFLLCPLPPVCAGVTGLFLRDGHPNPAREGCRRKGQS